MGFSEYQGEDTEDKLATLKGCRFCTGEESTGRGAEGYDGLSLPFSLPFLPSKTRRGKGKQRGKPLFFKELQKFLTSLTSLTSFSGYTPPIVFSAKKTYGGLHYTVMTKELFKISESLSYILQHRDDYTGLHSKKVAAITSEIAQFLELDMDTQKTLADIGELHDIGKLTWPDLMFTSAKKTKTPSIQHWIENHPIATFMTLKDIFPNNNDYEWLIAILCHHWNYAGKDNSYPEDVLQIIKNHFKHLPDFEKTKIMDALYNPIKPSLSSIDPNSLRLKIGIIRAADSIEAATAARPYKEYKDYNKVITEFINSDIYHPNVIEVLKSHKFATFLDSNSLK